MLTIGARTHTHTFTQDKKKQREKDRELDYRYCKSLTVLKQTVSYLSGKKGPTAFIDCGYCIMNEFGHMNFNGGFHWRLHIL